MSEAKHRPWIAGFAISFTAGLHPRLEVELETIRGWSFDRTYVYLGESDTDDDEARDEVE